MTSSPPSTPIPPTTRPEAQMTETTPDRAPVIPSTMRAAVAPSYGTEEIVTIDQVETPEPGEGEVLVHVGATSLNALDWRMMTGTPMFLRLIAGLRTPKRTIHGADVAGTVVAVGEGVEAYSVGDRVFGECNGGGLGEYLVARPRAITHAPAGIGIEALAATPCAGLTAIQGLRTHGGVEVGDHVLINGAAGGVGTFAVQIAKALGAEVTAVCSTRNVEMVCSIGADHVVDYTVEDFVPGGPRFDVMLDNVGNRSAKEVLSVLRPEARYVAVSGPMRNRLLGPIPHIARLAVRFLRASQTLKQFTAEPNAADLEALAEMLVAGEIVPQVQRVVGLDGVREGLAEIGGSHVRSKIVVMPGR
ncbi:MAG: NAD(P)-dependent alcohol dehydrogenase [Actinomycetota bacterium]